jgi:hypothetical protein
MNGELPYWKSLAISSNKYSIKHIERKKNSGSLS